MRTWQWAVLLFVGICVACVSRHELTGAPSSLTPARAGEVERDVRAFAGAVAHDVTSEGPTAWRRHLVDSPAFFLAANGQLVFANSSAATMGIQQFASTIKHIELRWDDGLRVDPLTPELAVVASPYHEIQINQEGKRVDEVGYFTGIAEYRNGQWQFRNAHWSEACPAAAAR
jgi:hypothetical protein